MTDTARDWLWAKIPVPWRELIAGECEKPYFGKLATFLWNEYRKSDPCICPYEHLLFRAFEEVDPGSVRVVFMGKDPYTDNNLACGLSFCVPKGQEATPSLKAVSSSVAKDCGLGSAFTADLNTWPAQGVLLINSTMTVEEGKNRAGTHKKRGWAHFTTNVLEALEETVKPIYVLCGRDARNKAKLTALKTAVADKRIIEVAHPSCRRGKLFINRSVFKEANKKIGGVPIDWAAQGEHEDE